MVIMKPDLIEEEVVKVANMKPDQTEEVKVVNIRPGQTTEEEALEQLVNLKAKPLYKVELIKVNLNHDVTFLQIRFNPS